MQTAGVAARLLIRASVLSPAGIVDGDSNLQRREGKDKPGQGHGIEYVGPNCLFLIDAHKRIGRSHDHFGH